MRRVEFLNHFDAGAAVFGKSVNVSAFDEARTAYIHRMFSTAFPTCGRNRSRFDDREAGIAELLSGLTAYTEQGNKLYVPFLQGLLCELEAENQNQAGVLIRIEEALAIANQTGEHWTDSFLNCIRGGILLKRRPVNTALAEEAFLTAIAIAKQQKAKSFELRAALSLANLYHSTGRPAEAHAVLVPALDGFSQTPEFSEIAEAQTLLATLSP